MMPIYESRGFTHKKKKELEIKHVKALADEINKQMAANKRFFCSSFPKVQNYINLVCSHTVQHLLIMTVNEMRTLVSEAEKFLPHTNFYRMRKPSPEEKEFIRVNNLLEKIFNYDSFAIQKGGWCLGELALELNHIIRICPYCNAETVYAYKITKAKRLKYTILKSAFDHYFPKVRYPFLSVSLYNLIPACTRCNTGFKGYSYEDLLKMAHPYSEKENMHQGMKFRVIPKNFKAFMFIEANDIDQIILSERSESFREGVSWERMFHLNETYTALYKDIAADIMLKLLCYPKAYVEAISTDLNRKGVSSSRIDRLFYGIPLDCAEINKYRHGKLILDLFETYG